MHGVKTNENEMENIQVIYEYINENEEGDEQYGIEEPSERRSCEIDRDFENFFTICFIQRHMSFNSED